jgi:hypothetical protein
MVRRHVVHRMRPTHGRVQRRAAVVSIDRSRWLSVRPVVHCESVGIAEGERALIRSVAISGVGAGWRSMGGDQRQTVRLTVSERQQVAGRGATVGGVGLVLLLRVEVRVLVMRGLGLGMERVLGAEMVVGRERSIGMEHGHRAHAVGRGRQ